MDKSLSFNWEKRRVIVPPRAKLMRKLPMEQKVLDQRGMLWKYYFINGKIQWIHLGYLVREGLKVEDYDTGK